MAGGRLQWRGTPRIMDWLESGLSPFPTFRLLEDERSMRCEESIEDGSYVLRVELPGVDPEKDVQVTVVDGVLTVDAERRETRKGEGRSEFYYGKLHRSLTLPEGADEDSVTASYRDGILQVTVALPSEETPPQAKRIEITRAEG